MQLPIIKEPRLPGIVRLKPRNFGVGLKPTSALALHATNIRRHKRILKII